MEQKEIEELVKKEVLKAKLEVTEKRLNYLLIIVGGFLTVFGFLLPLLLSNTSSNKVDMAIEKLDAKTEKMQTEVYSRGIESEKRIKESVKDIISQQNSALTTISNNAEKTIKETKEQVQTITASSLNWNNLILELLNDGDAPTRSVKAVMYFKKESKIKMFTVGQYWMGLGVGEEKEFTHSYEYRSNDLNIIDAKYSTPISLEIEVDENIKYAKEEVLLKVFFGQPEPARFAFFLEIKRQ